jgi:hypothetical protein
MKKHLATLICLCLTQPLWAEPHDSIAAANSARSYVMPPPRPNVQNPTPLPLPPSLLYTRYNLPETAPPKMFDIPHLRLQLPPADRQSNKASYITSQWNLFPGRQTIEGALNPALLPPLRMSKKDMDYLRGEGMEWGN